MQCDSKFRESHRDTVSGLGFILNEKKTSYSWFLTVNSTYFSSRLREIPYLRMGGFSCTDPRGVAQSVSSILGAFGPYHTRYRVFSRRLLEHFSWLVRQSRRSMFALGFHLHRQVGIPGPLWRREKRRVGPEAPLPLDDVPHGARMEKLSGREASDFEAIHDGDVARVVVRETWLLGDYEAPRKWRLRGVREFLLRAPTRRGRECAAVARSRLRAPKEKSLVLPKALVDCYLGLHSPAFIDPSGFVNVGWCPDCELFRERITQLSRFRGWQQRVDEEERVKASLKAENRKFVSERTRGSPEGCPTLIGHSEETDFVFFGSWGQTKESGECQ